MRDEHAALDGEEKAVDEAFSNGLQQPGEPNCLLPGTLVQGAYVAGLRAEYAGEVIMLRTAGGRELTVTPNHPVLTDRGFQPAGWLCEGDQLLAYREQVGRTAAMDQDEDGQPTLVEQVFGALAEQFPTLRRQASVDDLHGDARGLRDRQVDVVGPDRVLLLDAKSDESEEGGQRVFVVAAVQPAQGPSDGASQASLRGLLTSPAGLPGGAALAEDGLGVALQARPFDPLRIGPAAQLQASGPEAPGEERSAQAGFVRELLQRGAPAITRDQLVEVRYGFHRGQVYDLQSVAGWNVANGIVVSNCRCTLTYRVLEPDGTETEVEETP